MPVQEEDESDDSGDEILLGELIFKSSESSGQMKSCEQVMASTRSSKEPKTKMPLQKDASVGSECRLPTSTSHYNKPEAGIFSTVLFFTKRVE